MKKTCEIIDNTLIPQQIAARQGLPSERKQKGR